MNVFIKRLVKAKVLCPPCIKLPTILAFNQFSGPVSRTAINCLINELVLLYCQLLFWISLTLTVGINLISDPLARKLILPALDANVR